MPLEQKTDIKTVALQGGAITVREKPLLPFGAFSMIQNFRGKHPAFDKRKGSAQHHTTTLGATAKTLSLYQFSKGKRTERHFLAQMSDDDVYDATNAPPGTGTTFGSAIFTGTATSKPASWGDLDDILLFSNGKDQHQLYAGTDNYVKKFIKYPSGTDIGNNIPTHGSEYTKEVTDGKTTTYAILDSLQAYGTDKITNGTFDTDLTGWTDASIGDATVTHDTDHVELDANTGTAILRQTITGLLIGVVYNLILTISENCTSLLVKAGTSAYGGTEHFSIAYTSTGSKTKTFTAKGTELYLDFSHITDEIVSLDDITLLLYPCIFICCPIPANRLTWTFVSGKENDTAAEGTLSYWKNDHTWQDTTETDGTSKSTTDTLGQDGSMTWTHPTDEISRMMFGYSGFWYRWTTDTQIDSEVEVSSLTFGSSFSPLQNVWDAIAPAAIEAQFYDLTATLYKKYASSAIEIDSMAKETGAGLDDKDRLYFSTTDPAIGIYIEVGDKPNTNTTTVFNGTNGGIKVFTGEGWTTVGTVSDGTNGLTNSGWVTWARPPYSTTYYPRKTNFNSSQYYAYWYYIFIGTSDLSADVIINIITMPYFDIETLGAIGYVNCAWQNRAIYNFGDNIGYVSAKLKPMTLNGSDFGTLDAGDGRANRWTCAKKFHTGLLVWQEEKGSEGGCITLFEGSTPITFTKLLLSTNLGTLNTKSAVVIDGLSLPSKLDKNTPPATVAFFISHYGVFFIAHYGTSITGAGKPIRISDDIQNYFDPLETATCITRGAEDEMFVFHDTSYNVLRFGLVTGASGTVCNTFPVFDLADWTWSLDTLGQALSAMCEVEAASGDLSILQYGGGTNDGFIYQLNTGLNDYNGSTKTLITSYIRMEFNGQGEYLELRELLLLTKTQTAGDAELTVYKNNVAVTEVTDIDLSMIAENTNEIVRRHRKKLNVIDQHISIKIQHDEVDQGCYLEGLGVNMKTWENR